MFAIRIQADELTLAHTMSEFKTGNCRVSTAKGSKTFHGSTLCLDRTVVLFNNIVEVLETAHSDVFPIDVFLLQ